MTGSGGGREECESFLIRRTGKIALEVVGVAVAATAVLLAVLAWRLSSGPISMPILSQIFQDVAGQALSGGHLTIGDTVLRWSAKERELALRLVDVRVTGAEGNRVAAVPELSFRLSVPALFRGVIAPTSVELYGITAAIVRRPETGISLGLARMEGGAPEESPGEASAILAPMISTLTTGSGETPFLAYLTHLGIHDGTLRFVDEINGVTFEAPAANLNIFRDSTGVAGMLVTDVLIGGTRGHIEMEGAMPMGARAVEVRMRSRGIVPAALARMSPAFADYGIVDAPVDGNGVLQIRSDGTVLAARLMLDAGKGSFFVPELQDAPVPLEKAHADISLDAMERRLELKELALEAGPHRAVLRGRVDYDFDSGFNIAAARMDVRSDRVETAVPGFFEGPVDLADLRFKGAADFDAGTLDIETLSIGVAGGRIAVAGLVGFAPRSPALRMQGTLENIPVDTVRAIWPLPLSPPARDWVAKNMKGGLLDKGSVRIDVPAGMLADADEGEALPDERVHFEFTVKDTTVSYLGAMPPLQNVVARGLLQGNRFDAWVPSATVVLPDGKTIAVSKGHFLDGTLATKNSIGEIEFTAAGETAAILSLLDHEPLKLIRGFGLDPASIGGTGKIDTRLSLPLIKDVSIDEVDFSGKARAEAIAIPEIRKGLAVTAGALDIAVSKTGLKATGTVGLNGVPPLDIVWTESFVASKGPGSVYRLSGSLDDAAREALGLDINDFVSGPVQINATLTGKGADVSDAVIHADFLDSVLKADYLGWWKPAGKAASGDLKLSMKGGTARISDLVLAGEEIDVKGGFTIGADDRLVAADLPVLRLGSGNDLKIRAERGKTGELAVEIGGPKADARGLVRQLVSGSGEPEDREAAAKRMLTAEMLADPARRTNIRVMADDVTAPNGTAFRGLRADVVLIDDYLYLMDIAGRDPGGADFQASITPGQARTRRFVMTSSDAGFVMRALDLFTSLIGGSFAAEGEFDDTQPGSPMKGVVTARKFRIVNAPVLANILTMGSLTGIRDTLNGEGIYFDGLNLPFHITGHRIHVDEARMSGPAIGLTMKGQIDRASDVTDMEGTLVPAYTLNSVLGNVPLIGPLIVGREGEGIFGFTYAVKGASDNPSVIVNPLSAIAPGFLRRLFEFGSSLPPEQVTPAPEAPADKGAETAPAP